MLTLFLSVASSVAVSILLKLARRHALHIDQAIAMNYVVAASLCIALLKPDPASLLVPATPWWVLVMLGVLLPTIFLAMAGAVRHAGIVLSDAAQRLSLFIPLIAAFLIFQESATGGKLLGIGLALVALVCLLWRSSGGSASGSTAKTAGYLLAVWVGYGVIDVLFKQLSRAGAAFSSSMLVTFTLAGILSFVYLFARKAPWNLRSIAAGLLLGALNFSNIYFYIRAHQVFPDNPTLVFSAMNIGVISLGTLVGAGFFREKLTLVNVLGIISAIAAIVALIPR